MVKEFTFDGKTISILKNGTIDIKGIEYVKDKEGNQIPSEMSIWKMYENYRTNDSVIRSGSGLCGVYPFDRENPTMPNYIESDTLHSTTVEELAQNIFRFMPGLFPVHTEMRIIRFLRYHDLGETVDKPDDGSSSHDDKFAEELETFCSKIKYLGLSDQEQLIRDFIIFENGTEPYWSNYDREVMNFAKLCDKTDAPLGAFLYEKQGRKGSLKFKKDNFGGITDQDQRYADEIGEYSQAGIWGAHMIDTYKDYKHFELFVRIIAAACTDVRGHVFPWLYGFLKRRNIFTEEVRNEICS